MSQAACLKGTSPSAGRGGRGEELKAMHIYEQGG